MAAALVQTCHVSCCANRTPHVLSWGRGGLIAFGTCNSVALYDPKRIRIISLLNGHTGRVNAVQWIHREDCGPETHLVSGGSDNHVIVWEFALSAQCLGHTAPVFAVDAIYLKGEGSSQILIASAASDSTVKIWLYQCSQAQCLQTMPLGGGFAMDVSLGLLPGCAVPILACGGDDNRVHLYVQHDREFQKMHSLHGHEDWVRGLQWAAVGEGLFSALWSETLSASQTKSQRSLRFAVTLETVLAGHENWVYGIHWQPPLVTGGSVHQPTSLLSASMDKTMILWAPDEESGVWLEQVRVGEVGGNTLGFYGCQMSPDGSMIVAHAFHGALHLWRRDDGNWTPGVVISGHSGVVQDLSWDPDGDFLVTVGSDQTTRMFTPWKRDRQVTWHEVSRPQIHGYDMQCLTMVGRFQFVSGADEKVLRAFRATRNFVENFASITGVCLDKLLADSEASGLPEGASIPALGLSNKAVYRGEPRPPSPNSTLSILYLRAFYPYVLFSLSGPPPEDHLLQNTLWPEASRPEHGAILLWSVCSWRQLQTLAFHSLTVTQMAFSPDGCFLLAVSRDRTWSLWKQQDPTFALCAHTSKNTSVHARIIWSCDWSPDSKYFVTSSRDKKVIVWGDCSRLPATGESSPASLSPCSSILDVGDSCTAVSFCPVSCRDGSYLLAVGLESGRIALFTWRPLTDPSAGGDWAARGDQSHTLTVKRLRWRPRRGRAGHEDEAGDSGWLQLASAGADHSVKIFNVNSLAL
uniref:Elongator complex protein 2 n=1 Tax=Paramormyrops kingsleyae TaxID=1676925 RepID=A0A3B3QC63_9TELE